MRTKNAFNNALFSIVAQVSIFVSGILIQRLIILEYGSDVNGLSSTINQILAVLNLLQAGAAGAAIFQLFKPIAKEDFSEIFGILQASKRYFHKIGYIFIATLLILIPFFSFVSKGGNFSKIEIGLSFLIVGLTSSLAFFFTYYYDILFSAFQKRYYISISLFFSRIIYLIFSLVIIKFEFHFIYLFLSNLAATIIQIFILELVYRNTYKWKFINIGNQYSKNIKISNTKYLLMSQISVQLINSAPILIISFLHGFILTSVYTVYNLIITAGNMIINTLKHSVSSVFGSVVVSEDSSKTFNVFNLLQYVSFLIGTFLTSCTGVLILPFIKIYTLNMIDVNYYHPTLGYLVVCILVILSYYLPFNVVVNATGLFKETYKQSVFTSIASVVIGFLLSHINFYFAIFSLIVFYLTSCIYNIYILNKFLPWFSNRKSIKRLMGMILFSIISLFIGDNFQDQFTPTITNWLILAIITSIVCIVLLYLYSQFFEKKELESLKKGLNNIIKNKF